MKNKSLKLVLLAIFSGILILLIPNISNANTVNKLQKAININEDGSANVAEIWDVETDAGTEMYMSWKNIGDSSFQNIAVTDDRGVTYEVLGKWNTKATFSEKKEKCGINATNNGIELCWGISEYGKRKYKVTYEITNFVKGCQDSQYAYWLVFPENFGATVNSVVMRIQSAKKFDNTNSKIWLFGHPNGEIRYTEEGYIYIDSNGKIPSSDYLTMLIKFENNEFNVTSKNTRTFQSIYDEAMKGTENDKEAAIKRMINVLVIIAILIIVIQIINIVKRIIKWIKKPIYDYNTIYEGGRNLPSMKEIEYVRDVSEIGCNIEEAYFIIQKYEISDDKDKTIIIGAILLKWIKKGYIKITNSKSGIFDFIKKQYCIDIKELVRVSLENETEQCLRKILRLAAGEDYLLEPKEFKNYCKSNNRDVIEFFKNVGSTTYQKYRATKEIVDQRKKTKSFLRTVIHDNTVYKESLREKAIKLLGLKKFLLDYSQVEGKAAEEIELWDDYLVYAQLLGIADKVEKQFNTIYPDYQTMVNLNEPHVSTEKLVSSITSTYATAGLEMAEKWRKIEEERAEKERERTRRSSDNSSFSSYSYSGDRDRDSGSGGSSYSSGGSGASGSDSSGGFR